MQTTVSYGAKVHDPPAKAFHATVQIYHDAERFLCDVLLKEWDNLAEARAKGSRMVKTALEGLTHATKKNPNPPYDFDSRFPMFPSYLRKDVMGKAYGVVSSYLSNYANWEANGKKGKPPRLTDNRGEMPCFYRNNKNGGGGMGAFDSMLNGETDNVSLKLYDGKTWNWYTMKLRRQDTKYLAKFWSTIRDNEGAKACPPVLVIREIGQRRYRNHKRSSNPNRKHTSCWTDYGDKFYLRFSFQQKKDLVQTDVPVTIRRALVVDLGINCDATCSIMEGDGTVIARKFIDFASEKDRLSKLLGRVKRGQREHGWYGSRRLWGRINRINSDLSRKIASAIVRFAVENACGVIVFEHLDMKGKIRGSKKQRIHMWRKREIQEIATSKAHNALIRIATVCPWGTSKYAYDGSGEVTRAIEINGQEKNYSVCRFRTGKVYNCDLSASYNIGARYFLREWLTLMNTDEEEFVRQCGIAMLDPETLKKYLGSLPCVPKRTYSHFFNMFLTAKCAA